MKNNSLVINVVLAIAVVLLYILHFTGKSNKSADRDEIAGADSIAILGENLTVAWVNMDSVMSSYDMYFDIQKEMEAKGRTMETQMNTRTRSLEKEMMEFQEKVQKGLITRSQAQTMQQELAEKEQQLYQFRDELRMQFSEEEQVMLRRIQQSIYDFMKEYNKDKGYHVILSGSFGGPLLYGHPAIEVTKDVVNGLNAKYIETKPAEE